MPLRAQPLDESSFENALNSQSPIEILLLGHLYVQRALSAAVPEALPYPERLDLDKWSFSRLLELGSALGLSWLRPVDVGVLTRLNRLRNRLAHDLQFELGPVQELELYNVMSQDLRGVAFHSQPFDQFAFPEALRQMISSIVISIDVVRNRLVEDRRAWAEVNRRMEEMGLKLRDRHPPT